MDARPEKFDVVFWLTIAKLLGRLAALAMIALGGTATLEDWTALDLDRQEAKASTVDNRVTEAKRETDVAYEEWTELAVFYVAKDAACDSALESLSRHRADDDDFRHAIEECHSEGEIE
jgi:hypothetical protein